MNAFTVHGFFLNRPIHWHTLYLSW